MIPARSPRRPAGQLHDGLVLALYRPARIDGGVQPRRRGPAVRADVQVRHRRRDAGVRGQRRGDPRRSGHVPDQPPVPDLVPGRDVGAGDRHPGRVRRLLAGPGRLHLPAHQQRRHDRVLVPDHRQSRADRAVQPARHRRYRPADRRHLLAVGRQPGADAGPDPVRQPGRGDRRHGAGRPAERRRAHPRRHHLQPDGMDRLRQRRQDRFRVVPVHPAARVRLARPQRQRRHRSLPESLHRLHRPGRDLSPHPAPAADPHPLPGRDHGHGRGPGVAAGGADPRSAAPTPCSGG